MTNEELLEQIAKLKKENEQLQQNNASLQKKIDEEVLKAIKEGKIEVIKEENKKK